MEAVTAKINEIIDVFRLLCLKVILALDFSVLCKETVDFKNVTMEYQHFEVLDCCMRIFSLLVELFVKHYSKLCENPICSLIKSCSFCLTMHNLP